MYVYMYICICVYMCVCVCVCVYPRGERSMGQGASIRAKSVAPHDSAVVFNLESLFKGHVHVRGPSKQRSMGQGASIRAKGVVPK